MNKDVRQADVHFILGCVAEAQCCSIVGMSNVGKSDLLRLLTHPNVQAAHLGAQAEKHAFVYVDFNHMLEMTEQGFYELVLRSILDSLQHIVGADTLLVGVHGAYANLTQPASGFQVPLSFAQAMAALNEGLQRHLVLLFDEFDEPLAALDGQVFLNLRALKDRYPRSMTYVTATNQRLSEIRRERSVGEFNELFAHRTWYLKPFDEAEARDFIAAFAAREGVTFSENDVAFILQWAGGHLSLLEGVCRVLGPMTGKPVRDASQEWIIHREVATQVQRDTNLRSECVKIWQDLTPNERDGLLALFAPGDGPVPEAWASLRCKGLLVGPEEEPAFFCRLFAEFVQREHVARRGGQQGVWVDVDAGDVYVNGRPTPTLTDLEYRLLLLLYGRLNKICDKYQIVEAVWGEEYIDEVDDARVDKLMSRLRVKIEADPANPRYLLTVRGRGYKLVSG
ncbi:MAG: helix-turn-helix domain-containing protein [Anaerolineae bacterium]|nr:helix-turn-helix domain-containing protein [Anaerolineae bacterium]